jgi:hypothetical protein
MPSPFPGMDPYLELPRRWPSFHNDLAAEISAALNQLLVPGYVSSLTSSVVYWEIPLMLYQVEIITTEEEQLIAAIEILSPANKRPGHETTMEYRRNRRDLFRSSAHLVEIDLLRAGERPPLEKPVPAAPYYVMVSRDGHRPRVGVWPIQLKERLPVIPVPLLEPDLDVLLDLGAAVASVYERGAYARKIDYRQPPPAPPLSDEEAAWADALLGELGIQRASTGEDR